MEVLQIIANASLYTTVVLTMFCMGLSFSPREIIAPLGNIRLVVTALLINFVAIPLYAIQLLRLIPVDDAVRTAIILLSISAGSAILPKLSQLSNGHQPFSIGLMGLLTLTTILILPFGVQLAVGEAVTIDRMSLLFKLTTLMLVPLLVGGVFRALASASTTRRLFKLFNPLSSLGLFILIAAYFTLHFNLIIEAGYLVIVLCLALLTGSTLLGYLGGSKDLSIKKVMALGAGWRNVTPTLIVANVSFNDQPLVLTMLLLVGLLSFMTFPLLSLAFARYGSHASPAHPDSTGQPQVVTIAGKTDG